MAKYLIELPGTNGGCEGLLDSSGHIEPCLQHVREVGVPTKDALSDDEAKRIAAKKRGRTVQTHDANRSLLDEVLALKRDAEAVAEMAKRGAGAFELHEELQRRNLAYKNYVDQQAAGADFARQAREVGRKLQERFKSKDLRPEARTPEPEPEEESFRDQALRIGKQMKSRQVHG